MRSDDELRAFVDSAPTFTRDPHSGNGATPRELVAEAAKPVDPTFVAHDIEDLDQGDIPPRQWLLSTVLCRRFVTVLAASGGSGKTTLILAWALSLAVGRALVGDHVHKRSCVLILTFEDDVDEYRRRLRAARMHHGVGDVGHGWCHIVPLAGIGITLATAGKDGALVETDAAQRIIELIRRLRIDVAIFDPFVKLSDADENDNRASDFVARVLVRIAIETDVAVLVAHHFRKGLAEAGNIDAARGARAIIDASRAALTLLPMSGEEAKRFEISEQERRRFVRLDDGKANLVLGAESARWYRLASVAIGNATDDYPHGDNVQAIERWRPPDTWEGLSHHLLNRILDELDTGMPDGERYSAAPSARKRAAWRVVQAHAPHRSEAQCRQVITTWLGTGLLRVEEYDSPTRREAAEGVVVDASKRPGTGAR